MKDPLEDTAVGVTRTGATRILLAFVVGLVALFVLVPGSRTPLLIILGIVVMVMLHEAGHYWTAKRAGMKVTEFFLGFGPRLWSVQRGETEYGVKALPLGGYVRIIGMSNLEEVDPADEPRTYRQGSYSNRLKVVLAGVTVNLIIAFVLFFAVIV
ncbi:MAG TPA: site-2 protease family protein, partial [Acidimicrobiia bacterium]